MYKLYFDGASRGNPGHASYGFVIYDKNGEELSVGCQYIGKETNNVAEYMGLLKGLESAVKNGYKELEIYGDSNLIIKQLKKEYKTNAKLKPFYDKAQEFIKDLVILKMEHVYRNNNKRADELANIALNNTTF